MVIHKLHGIVAEHGDIQFFQLLLKIFALPFAENILFGVSDKRRAPVFVHKIYGRKLVIIRKFFKIGKVAFNFKPKETAGYIPCQAEGQFGFQRKGDVIRPAKPIKPAILTSGSGISKVFLNFWLLEAATK